LCIRKKGHSEAHQLVPGIQENLWSKHPCAFVFNFFYLKKATKKHEKVEKLQIQKPGSVPSKVSIFEYFYQQVNILLFHFSRFFSFFWVSQKVKSEKVKKLTK